MHDKFVYALEIITIYSSSFKFWFVQYAEMDIKKKQQRNSLTLSRSLAGSLARSLARENILIYFLYANMCGHVSDICYLSSEVVSTPRKLDTMQNRSELFPKDYCAAADKMTTKPMHL